MLSSKVWKKSNTGRDNVKKLPVMENQYRINEKLPTVLKLAAVFLSFTEYPNIVFGENLPLFGELK